MYTCFAIFNSSHSPKNYFLYIAAVFVPMKNINQFDVLVVYSHGIAKSADSVNATTTAPFIGERAHYNNAYAYFLTVCAENNLKAAFTTSADIIGNGTCKSYWLFENNNWIAVKNACFSRVIFDKFSPKNKNQKRNRAMFFGSSEIQPYNDDDLLHLFFDKHKTYEGLPEFSLPTTIIENSSMSSIEHAWRELKKSIKEHPQKEDFSRVIVIKDRFGSGGNNIYKIGTNFNKRISAIMQKNKKTSFILQPFAKFDKGYSYKNNIGFTDIRLIYQGNKLVQTYIRMAKKTDFRCNVHQGGISTY